MSIAALAKAIVDAFKNSGGIPVTGGSGGGGGVADTVSISDGTDTLAINPDGGISTAVSTKTQTGAISANGDVVVFNCEGYSSITFQVNRSTTGSYNIQCSFECSNDNANWEGLTVTRLSNRSVSQVIAYSGGTTADSVGIYGAQITTKYVRVRGSSISGTVTFAVIGHLSNSPQQLLSLGDGGSVSLSGSVNIGGTIASGSNDSGNPVKIGAKYNSTLPTFTNGQRGDLQIDSSGRLLTASSFVSQTYVTSTISTSGDNIIIAAPGAGLSIYITSLMVQLEAATATTVLIKDGATVKKRVLCQNQGDGLSKDWNAGREFKLTANTAFILNLSGANSVGYSVEYYIA